MRRSKESKIAQKNSTSNGRSSSDTGMSPVPVDSDKTSNVDSSRVDPLPPQPPIPPNRPKYVFRCQKAHGSPTGLISGFSNVKELYQRIAECYAFPIDQLLFCTLNTPRIDMNALLSAQLSLEDFIFVHLKGNSKEVEITKTSEALGLTITDNGTGYAFIKRIKEGSIAGNTGVIEVGDHLEVIGGQSVVGWRHIEVAKYLRSIQIGQTFILRLVEPIRAGFGNVGAKTKKPNGHQLKDGKQTLRLNTGGPATLEIADSSSEVAIAKLNTLLENFVGISDVDLAKQILELTNGKKNVEDFIDALQDSELECFEFSDNFLKDAWTISTKLSNQINF